LANTSYTQSFLTCTQHIFLISKNTLNSGNKNLKMKIIYFRKINLKTKIKILFQTKKSRNENNIFQEKENLEKRLLCFENENPEKK